MKKHENIIKTIGAVALLLGVVLMPCINATILEGKTVKTKTETTTIKENDYNKNEKNTDYEPLCTGVIYGKTGYYFSWGVFGLPFTLVEAQIGKTVVRKDRSNFFCNYRLVGLPLGHTYNVTASSDSLLHYGDKCYRFVNQTISITLTPDKPFARLDFFLDVELIDDPGDDNLNTNIYQFLEPMQEYYGNSQNNLLLQAAKATNR